MEFTRKAEVSPAVVSNSRNLDRAGARLDLLPPTPPYVRFLGAHPIMSDGEPNSGPGGDAAITADHHVARAVSRLSATYILRTLPIATAPFGGDVLLAVVAWGILSANVEHIDHPTQGDTNYQGLNTDVPHDLRRPVSILALAQSLGLPYETTRRHVNRLLEAGICQKVGRAGVISVAALDSPEASQMMLANVQNIRRLYRDLRRLDIQLD